MYGRWSTLCPSFFFSGGTIRHCGCTELKQQYLSVLLAKAILLRNCRGYHATFLKLEMYIFSVAGVLETWFNPAAS